MGFGKTKVRDGEAIFCSTASKDVGRLVAKSVGMKEWPPEMRMVGERMSVERLVEILEGILGSKLEVGTVVRDLEELQEIGFEVEGRTGDRVEAAVGVRRGEWGWDEAGEGAGWVDLRRIFEGTKVMGFREWLMKKMGERGK